VLNPGGVRIGTAEIYRSVEGLPEILESLAVGQEWNNDVRIVLFVKLREGITLDTALMERVKPAVKWSWGIEEANFRDRKPIIKKTKEAEHQWHTSPLSTTASSATCVRRPW
jgi:hypothetical protein